MGWRPQSNIGACMYRTADIIGAVWLLADGSGEDTPTNSSQLHAACTVSVGIVGNFNDIAYGL